MRHPRSIRFKLITLYAGLLAFVFFCFGAYIYIVLHQLLVRSLEQTVFRRAEQVATILDERPSRDDGYVASEIQARYAPELNERAIRIVDAQQREIYVSKNARFLAAHSLPALENQSPAKTFYWEQRSTNGDKYRVVGLYHRLAGGSIYLVEVGAPETGIRNALQDLVLTLLIGFPVLIGLSIFGGYSLLGRALRPVDEIVGAAERITFKDRNQRLPVPETGDEFERISEALNRMIERLDESFQIANRFSGDASHELRTPLTILQGELEAFLNDASLPSEAVEQAANMLEEVVRLARIVEGLLLVSRLEAGEAQMKRSTVDLGNLAAQVGEQMQLLCDQKLLTLKYEIGADVYVEGDELRLRQVVVNLLDNAIKYTSEGGTITLAVRAAGTAARLEVTDTGIGISPAALPRVFERFFRSEEARASRMQGSGLGLAIVKSIAEAHGGKVEAASSEHQGTRFCVELTRTQSPAPHSHGGVHLVV